MPVCLVVSLFLHACVTMRVIVCSFASLIGYLLGGVLACCFACRIACVHLYTPTSLLARWRARLLVRLFGCVVARVFTLLL